MSFFVSRPAPLTTCTARTNADRNHPGVRLSVIAVCRAVCGPSLLVLGLMVLAGAKEPSATRPETLKVLKSFKVDLLYTVPKDKEGSWVAMCVDPKGRLIVSDQYGGLYRLTLPPVNVIAAPKVEPIPVTLGESQGLVWAFDALYVMVNTGGKFTSGVYRVTDANGDDVLDSVESIRTFESGKGEHGPHALLAAPDGSGLYVVVGNQTKLTKFDRSRVPTTWGEDHLLPRMPDGRGFMKGVLGPGGAIYKIDPLGKTWELVSVGYRNQYDAAFNSDGELFTFDADMEWDINTPWYRPTRVCHVVSGSEYGWRNGAGKWPEYYVDGTPPVVNIGPGSPTGVSFGYGAKFPAKYQQAFFICDWSYGKLYAVHLQPSGSSYTATAEEFVTGTPLPLTDLAVNPADGAMYFLIGGRKTTSGLYRVTYTGTESTAPAVPAPQPEAAAARALRKSLEAFHGVTAPEAIDAAWPHMASEDRFLRSAARIAIEHQPVESWRTKALEERRPQAAIQALLALTHASASCPLHRTPQQPPADPATFAALLTALDRLEWPALTPQQRLDLIRVYHVLLNRFGPPDDATRQALVTKFDPLFPAGNTALDAELGQLLVYLQSPAVTPKLVAALTAGQTQEEQIEYARSLRMQKAGWTPALRQTYFEWFLKAAGYHGGASFALFVQNIRNDALTTLTPDEAVALKPVLERTPDTQVTRAVAPPRPLVKEYSLSELVEKTDGQLKARDFARGKRMFAAANCFACHRFDNQGGALGPDLTGSAGRFSVRDMLESIVEPSKVISDQYAAVTVVTTDGKTVTGRIVNLAGENLKINTNMLNPNEQVSVDQRKIEEIVPSTVSMMPAGLLNTLTEDEVLDLLAYLLSRGDPKHPMFQAAGGE